MNNEHEETILLNDEQIVIKWIEESMKTKKNDDLVIEKEREGCMPTKGDEGSNLTPYSNLSLPNKIVCHQCLFEKGKGEDGIK